MSKNRYTTKQLLLMGFVSLAIGLGSLIGIVAALRPSYTGSANRAEENRAEEVEIPVHRAVELSPSPSPVQSTPEKPVEPSVEPSSSPSQSPQPIRASKAGNCECPYDTDRAGRACGGRSAYSRLGGRSGAQCYTSDQ
jgi:hypothetical protein